MANEQQSQMIIKRETKPLFADVVIVEGDIKFNKKDVKDRESFVRILFTDSKTAQVVSEIVIPRLLAKDLQNFLGDIINKIEEMAKSGELPKQPIQAKSKDGLNYVG